MESAYFTNERTVYYFIALENVLAWIEVSKQGKLYGPLISWYIKTNEEVYFKTPATSFVLTTLKKACIALR